MPSLIEIGNFRDLEVLVQRLNEAFEEMNYRLEPVPDQKGVYLFIEDPLAEEEYECGVLRKRGRKIYAVSPEVHAFVLGAYERYLEKMA